MSDSRRAPFVVDIEQTMRRGMLFVLVGFVSFLLWAMFAPLKSAAVAPGVVVADSRNKAIQHLEGGILREVLVREGETVRAGDVLARLDSAAATANLGRLSSARLAALAQEARLIAERDGLETVTFPETLRAESADSQAGEAMRGQAALFAARREAQASERGILGQRIAQYEEEINGIAAQVAAEDRQLSLIAQELETVRDLVKKGYEKKPRLLALERTAADLSGRRGEHLAAIARARQSIAEIQERLVNLKATHLDETIAELREVQTKLADLGEQMVAATDASRRLAVTAPVAGTVVSVFHQAPGSVIKPGETILELVPDQDQLVVEAQVRPEDIDSVTPDAVARVRLTAYSQRRTSSLRGRVVLVSADRILDSRGEKAHFLARVVVDMDGLAEDEGLKLYPGMPAVVFIETGRQSMLDYLLAPLFAGIERGMREE